jgi:Domain of unknown function (DUF4190)
MAISLKCVCGAVLDIDDRFQGQKIPCPDCNRLLDTAPPLGPPRTTSGWAVAAFVLPLVGMLTFVGPVGGVVCGVLGLRQIRHDPTIGGRNFARAGIALGGTFAVLSMLALTMGEFFNVDGMLRVFMTPRDLQAQSVDKYVLGLPPPQESVTFAMLLPTRGWIKIPVKNVEEGVDLTLANPWLDMQTVCFAVVIDEKEDDARMKAIQRFLETKLVKDLGHGAEPPPFPNPEQIKTIGESPEKGSRQLFEVDLVLGRISRVFLFRTWWEKTRLNAVVVGCRKSRFASEEETLHKLLDAAKLEEVKN